MATVVRSARVRVSKAPGQFAKETELNVKNALKAMADAVLQRTQMLDGHGVPIRNGDLQSSGLVGTRDNGLVSYVQFGNGLKYARYQEFAPDGWNYTTPGTGNRYLKTAGDSVKKEGIKRYI